MLKLLFILMIYDSWLIKKKACKDTRLNEAFLFQFYSPHIDFKKRGMYPDPARPDIDLRPH